MRQFFTLISTPIISLALLFGCTSASNNGKPSSTKGSNLMPAQHVRNVQVVGLIWLNPLQRRDYSTEWQILWTLGQVKPNNNDEMLRKEPKEFSSIQYVSLVADGNNGESSPLHYHQQYLGQLARLLHDNYYSDPEYFYNVHDLKRKKSWRELAGIHIEYALPNNKFDTTIARQSTLEKIENTFAIGAPFRPTLWTRADPPVVNVTAGGPNAGFTSLKAAIDYLEANPDKTAWAMGWDAPSFPREKQINENLVVLVLAGPTYKTGRSALAWIARPEAGNVQDVSPGGETPRTVQAWQATMHKASGNANIKADKIGYVIHDANNTHPDSSTRLGPLAQTLTTEVPDLDWLQHSFNTPALLGEMGAGSALTNVALAIGYANHFGKHVMVAGTTDPAHPTAVVVSPPAVVRPIDPDKPWFRARSMSNAYLPWWGLRDDAPPQPQGYSK